MGNRTENERESGVPNIYIYVHIHMYVYVHIYIHHTRSDYIISYHIYVEMGTGRVFGLGLVVWDYGECDSGCGVRVYTSEPQMRLEIRSRI